MNRISLQAIFNRRILVTFFYGFSSGLPLLATGSTLQAWLQSEGIDIKTIGLLGLAGLPYTLKFLWAPMLDHFHLPFLCRRKGWIILSQILLLVSFLLLSFANPLQNLTFLVAIVLLITFFSATQDIVLDAHRRDTLHDEEIGLGSSFFVNGYRIGMLSSGAMALYLSDSFSWQFVYLFIACCMFVGILTNIISPSTQYERQKVKIRDLVFAPIMDFIERPGVLPMMLFIFLFKVGDSLASSMNTLYILELGYSRSDLASIAKVFGLTATIIGGVLGGLILFKISLRSALIIFGLLQAVSTLGFIALNHFPIGYLPLASVIAFENISSGLGTTAFVAYMAIQTNKQFSATQYAILSSLTGVPRVILGAYTGYIATYLGWDNFYFFCTLVAIPGLLLLYMKKV